MSQVFRALLVLTALGAAFGFAQAAVSAGRTAPSYADTTDRLTRLVPLPPGASIRLEVTIGQVQVSAWDRPDVSVAILRRAPDASALDRIPVDIETTAEAVVIRAVQTGNGRDAAVRSDVVLRVPAAARITALDVFEGDVELSGLSAGCAARVERGDITARDLTGSVRLETAIGAIRLERATLSRDGMLRLRTFNGDVEVALAAAPEHARILALSMGGAITSDIPLTRRERWGPRWAEATIGDGQPVLSVDVVNGDIAIRVAQ
jgi:hypothetical protein